MMKSSQDVLNSALQLKSYEKFFIIEKLLQSLEESNQEINEIWAIEAENRLNAYRTGQLKGIPMEDIFDREGES